MKKLRKILVAFAILALLVSSVAVLAVTAADSTAKPNDKKAAVVPCATAAFFIYSLFYPQICGNGFLRHIAQSVGAVFFHHRFFQHIHNGEDRLVLFISGGDHNDRTFGHFSDFKAAVMEGQQPFSGFVPGSFGINAHRKPLACDIFRR